MATLGAFDPELRREALFDPTLVTVGWFDPELIDAAGAGGLTMAPAGATSTEQAGAGTWSVGAVTMAPAGAPSTERAAAGVLAPPPTDVAVTILDYATLGNVRGPTGGSTHNHLIYAQNSGRWWFFTYAGILDSGTATGAGQSTSQLVDTSKTWTAGTFHGASCLITGGTGAGQVFEIGANTTTALTVENNGVGGTIQTAPGAGSSTYVIIESRRVKAYVSSSNDLSSATWALATNGTSAAIQNNTGIDMSGGRNDGGGFGEFPTDARLLAMGYASISGVDVVMALAQQNVHWFKVSLRGKLGLVSAGTMAWDSPGATNTNPWDDGFPGNECAPTFLQGSAIANSTTNRWHALHHQNTIGIVGYPQDANDTGTGDTVSESLDWAGTRATYDSTSNSTNFPHQSALAQLASGVMLAVHTLGNSITGFGAGLATQTGLRWVVSSSATAWPITSTAATIGGLSSTANSPNDWGMVGRTTTDVHVVRRNSGTVLEHVRFDGTSWGSVTTLPTSSLTGHVSNSGIGLATDGTTVWCVVLDSDVNNSIKYLTWTAAGGWASSWTTLSTNNNAKSFLSVHQRVGNNQIGVAWTEGPDGSGRYTVRGAAISATVALTISPAGSASDERSGPLTGQVGAVSLAPAAAGSGELTSALSAQSVAAVAPAGAPSQEAAGSLAATSTASLSPAGAPSAERAAAATVTSAAAISPAGSPTTETSGPAALTSTASLAPAGAPTSEREAAGALGSAAAIAPAGTPTQEAVGVAAAIPGATTMAPAGAMSSEQAGAGAFIIGAPPQTMAPAGATSSEASSALAGVPGTVTASLAASPSSEQSAAAAFSSFVTLQPAAPVSEERVAPAQFAAGFVVIAPAGARSTERAGAGSFITFTQTAPWYRVPTAAPFIGTGVLAATNVGTGLTGAADLGAGLTSSTNLGTGQLVAANVGAPSGGQTQVPNLGDGTTGALNAGTGQTSGDYLEKPGG